MKLRTRITLSMLVTSLLALGVVGVIANQRLMSKFSDEFAQASTRNFRADVAGYIGKWGSWENAVAHEDFRSFAEHRRDRQGRPVFTGLLNNTRDTEPTPTVNEPEISVDRNAVSNDHPDQRPPRDDRRERPPHDSQRPDQQRPPHDPQGQPPETDEEVDRPPRDDRGPRTDRPGATVQTRNGPVEIPYGMVRAPFRFTLFDTNGKTLMAIAPYKVGDTVSDTDRKSAIPIEVNGEVRAWLLPKAGVNFSDLDLGYISAMRESLMIGLGAAALLALGLGLLLGNYLSSNLQKLTQAIRHLQQGELGRQIEINSKDEVGQLAQAFNHMSEELARSHDELRASHAELRESHEKIAEQAEILRDLALRDSLTRLHNRRHFDEQACRLFRRAQQQERPLTVMMGDIDHFKQINDKFSHAVGDSVLRRVGELLRKHTRTGDLVARYGGEEFVIAFVDTSLEQAHQLCDKLRTQIASEDWSDIDPQLKVTMSIGVAQLQREETIDQVVQLADVQLYRAKSGGRNQVCKAA